MNRLQTAALLTAGVLSLNLVALGRPRNFQSSPSPAEYESCPRYRPYEAREHYQRSRLRACMDLIGSLGTREQGFLYVFSSINIENREDLHHYELAITPSAYRCMKQGACPGFELEEAPPGMSRIAENFYFCHYGFYGDYGGAFPLALPKVFHVEYEEDKGYSGLHNYPSKASVLWRFQKGYDYDPTKPLGRGIYD